MRTYVWAYADGTWAPEAATYPTDPSDPNLLSALVCPAVTRCYAAGYTISGAHGSVVTAYTLVGVCSERPPSGLYLATRTYMREPTHLGLVDLPLEEVRARYGVPALDD